MNTILKNILMILAILGIAFLVYWFWGRVKPEPITRVETVVKYDTVKVVDSTLIDSLDAQLSYTKRNVITTKRKLDKALDFYQGVIDSLNSHSKSGDTISINNPVAYADTIFHKDGSSIRINYYFPPMNYFMIAADIAKDSITTTKTVTELKYVDVEVAQSFYKDIWFYFTLILTVLTGIAVS